MDEKKKEWIKDNAISIICHIIIILVYATVIFTVLDMYSLILSDTSMLTNIFASVTVFGAITSFTLIVIYLEMWTKKAMKFKIDYDKHMEK